MAKLAIKGHATRGKEVIEILEMLGGNNANNCYGKYYDRVYYINENGYIDQDFISHIEQNTKFIIYTLEQFEEKFPYKVGDKVIIKCKNQEAIIDRVVWCCDTITYWLKYDGIIEGNRIVEHLQPYKEETMADKLEQITFDIPDGYEFFGINDDNQVVLAKKQPQYPKNYDECCEVLDYEPDRQTVTGYDADLIEDFQTLKLCRDAYWKIAGDWKPDWSNLDDKYTISIVSGDKILLDTAETVNTVLAFPTAEMRDTFYENFKKSIEQCKELL